jgi:hypothetical protein
MKKSKTIQLLLVTATLASCHSGNNARTIVTPGQSLMHIRTDTTAGYTRAHNSSGVAGGGRSFYYRAFRPYGDYYCGSYHRAGYYSDAISEHSNFGHNSAKGAIARGGFGGGHLSASS